MSLKRIIKKLHALGWSDEKDHLLWKYGDTNRYLEIKLPYIDFFILDYTGKWRGYLTVKEFFLFSKLVKKLSCKTK